MQPRVKLWLEKDGELVFSYGRADLLRRIEALGSLTAAAREMGMSYRAAWGKLRKCEEHLGIRLLATQAGGQGGGSTVLTPEAREFLRCFETWRNRVDAAVRESFAELFAPEGGREV